MEWEEVDPGRKKREIRPREAARLGSAAERGASVTWRSPALPRGPGPARRGGESPAAAAPPHALPRRPRARGRPGQVAAVPGSGRPGAAASERAAAAPDRRPARTSSRGACGARCPGPGSPARVHSPASSGAFLSAFPPSPRGRSSPGAPFLAAASDHPAQPAERTADARRDGGAAPAPAERGKPAGGGKGTKAAAGQGSGRAGEEGRLPPLMNINRACGLASRPGPAQTRVRAPARRRAQRAGRGSPPLFFCLSPPGAPTPFS